MTKPVDEQIAPFDDPMLEREWQAQERALQRERLHPDSTDDDARSGHYRLLARALREERASALPADFAQRMAARVSAQPARHVSADVRFESLLLHSLAVVLVLATGAVVMIYGQAWLAGFAAMVPNRQPVAMPWLLTLAGCLGASWLLGRWHRPPSLMRNRMGPGQHVGR